METLMKSERKIFLSEEEDNKVNGYYGRTLNAGSFKIDLNVPRDRKGRFRPKVLPEPYRRVNEDYVNLLMSLVANGYSEGKIESTLNSLGLDYSKQHMEIIKQDLLERLNDFKTRELPSDIAIL
jgi:Transposase and inactivated derivatives